MEKFKIIGKNKLSGEFTPSGAKNAAIKMVTAALLIRGKTTFHNIPKIADIERMVKIIQGLGAKVTINANTIEIDSSNVNSYKPNEADINKLRGSVVIIGPLLSLFGKADFSEPGGCLIGARPIDTHLNAFKSLGVEINTDEKNNRYYLKTNELYKSGDRTVILDEMSVTATENIIMASVFRKGKTKIEIAACEPEIVDLANFLNKAGAKITGAGTNIIEIEGVKKLSPIEYTIIPDRIEVGTMAIAVAITGGDIKIKNIIPSHLSLVFRKFRMANMDFDIVGHDKFRADLIIKQKSKLKATNIDTRPFPGFPTDLQSQFAVMMTQAFGHSRIFETLFSSRFDYVKWLEKMGATIDVMSPHLIDIHGPRNLTGKPIESNDLRGCAALILAALVADGETEIKNVRYIDRGYENFDLRLRELGADIERIT